VITVLGTFAVALLSCCSLTGREAVGIGTEDVEAVEPARVEQKPAANDDKAGQDAKPALPARDGFVILEREGRCWIFREGSKELAAFKTLGEPDKHVTRLNVLPYKLTLKAPDVQTLEEYLTAKPGFVTKYDDGRLWVFRKDSKELQSYLKDGELARHVVRPGMGPRGMTIKGPDAETLVLYVAAQDGFETILEEGRLWVFRAGCKELDEFKKQGELARHITRIHAGPMRLTVKAPDGETIDAYLKARGQ